MTAVWHSMTLGVALVGLTALGTCRTPSSQPTPGAGSEETNAPVIRGTVRDQDGPVAGAVVRVQATTHETTSDEDGRFALTGFSNGTHRWEGAAITVSAWKHGYYCTKAEGVTPPANDIVLLLCRYQTSDNPDYEWMPPVGEESCASCKAGVTGIWLDNAHANAAGNPRFLTMYNGTDVSGRQSPPTPYAFNRDYGRVPLPPDSSQPYYGPGLKLDFPNIAGNCAACHTPGAAIDDPYGTDPNTVTGADTFGVHCDLCHKTADVLIDPATGLPRLNMPGVLSMDVRRPFPDDPERFQLFFGTFDDDNVPEEDTYLPLIETSQFCAPCHFGIFWDVLVYNSFGEWLDSPYSDPDTGQTCQDCHMPAPSVLDGEILTNVAPGEGGVERDPMTIHAHTQPGAADHELLRNAVTMTVTAQSDDGEIIVQVDITNDQTGHHVPTDSPLRHLILLVSVTDVAGNAIEQLDGETLPDWCGVGDPSEGCHAGLPGKAFAKVLEELWTEISPTGAYWNPIRLVSDNRIAAFATDSSTYTFAAPDEGEVTVEVTLLFRRAFHDIMRWKGWDVPDIVMEEDTMSLPFLPS